MNTPTVLKPPRTPEAPEIKLTQTTLHEQRAWRWSIRADDGRLVGFGICYSRADAIERAMAMFPRAVPPDPETQRAADASPAQKVRR